MRIEIACYETDNGTPIEVASALISHMIDEWGIDVGKRTLGEIAEHIQVYLKYSTKGADENG